MRYLSRKKPVENMMVMVKRVSHYIFKDCKMTRTFGLFVTVKNRTTNQIQMADFIDNYSTSRKILDRFIERLFGMDPYQIQDVVDDVKRGRELDEMGFQLAENRSEKP